MIDLTIGEKIKHLRNKRNLTQKELAKMSGIAVISLQQYESNKRTPKTEQIIKISNAFEVPIDFFLVDFEDKLYNKENWPNSEEERKKISQEKYLIRTFNLLNNLGKEEALKHVEELVLVPKYVDEEPQPPTFLFEEEKRENIDKRTED